ncbi:Glycoside hydrolase family 43 [Lasiodiplodia theobromae]|nr:Glycoside hydrolase family 43 [Lasiodiplodia theobromae]
MDIISVALLLLAGGSSATNTSYYTNPVLPGFHPDPSCIYVDELDQTFFCATSTFTAFPGVPIHASKDLVNWKLASNVLNRREQIPDFASAPTGQDGIFAPTLRYHDGTFYLITTNVAISSYLDFTMDNIIFTTTDPYNSSSWSIPTSFDFAGYDPSLFWDDDGTAYYDGWYYILVAEGGTARKHRGAIARSRNVTGPYENYAGNPFVAAASNSSYIQSVGHADLFHDAAGNWWGVALAMRCGPEFETYPMGRETVLYPVSWPEGEWPALVQGVSGRMEGPLPLPRDNRSLPGEGSFHDAPDVVDFEPGTTLPEHFVHVRFPKDGAYVVSPPGRENALQLALSPRNLSSPLSTHVNLTKDITFVGRRQVDTLFTFSVDLLFEPAALGEEAGVAAYLDEKRHVDMGITYGNGLEPRLRLQAFSSNENVTVPSDVWAPLPAGYKAGDLVRLEVRAANVTHFTFSVGVASESQEDDVQMAVVGYAEGSLLSGGYTGTILGAYATSNGVVGNGTSKAFVSRWRYQGQGQYIGDEQFV